MNNPLVPRSDKWRIRNTILLVSSLLMLIRPLSLFFRHLDGSLSQTGITVSVLLSVPALFLILGVLLSNNRFVRWGRNGVMICLVILIIAMIPYDIETSNDWNHQLYGIWWYVRSLIEITFYCVLIAKSDKYLTI